MPCSSINRNRRVFFNRPPHGNSKNIIPLAVDTGSMEVLMRAQLNKNIVLACILNGMLSRNLYGFYFKFNLKSICVFVYKTVTIIPR
jgi:hypothetical protein